MNLNFVLDNYKQSRDEENINKAKSTEGTIVLYGVSVDVADRIYAKIKKSGLEITYIVYDEDCPLMIDKTLRLTNIPVKKVTEIDSIIDSYIVFLGFVKGYEQIDIIKSKFKNATDVFYLSEIFDMEIISPQFVKDNIDSLDVLYNSMFDERSKQSYMAYLQSKLNQDMKYLPQVFEKIQYFPQDIISLTEQESYFDCGAFTGDTIADFLKYSSGKYKHIWAAEPDVENYMLLQQFIIQSNLKNITLYNQGIYSHKGRLPFYSEGSMLSMITDNAAQSIEVDTIDNITAANSVTFIKLDVEGVELEVLKGAEQTIRQNKPILAVSIYHRERDFIDIPQYIKSIAPDYYIFFRAHKKLAIDAVLYFIPPNRLKKL